MAIHFRNGNYCCTNLLDGDDRLYAIVTEYVSGYRCNVQQRLIPEAEEIGLAEPNDDGKTATIRFRPAAEQIRRLRSGEVVDQTVWIVPLGTIEAACWYPKSRIDRRE